MSRGVPGLLLSKGVRRIVLSRKTACQSFANTLLKRREPRLGTGDTTTCSWRVMGNVGWFGRGQRGFTRHST